MLMKQLGMVSILLFLSFLVSASTIYDLLLFYLSPLLSEIQFFCDSSILKVGLMCISLRMIISSINGSSGNLSSGKEAADNNMSYELCVEEGKFELESRKNDALSENNPAGLHETKKKDEQQKICSSIGNGIEKDEEDDDDAIEDDEALERRIKEFIAKSYSRWEEELQEEKFNHHSLSVNNTSSSYYLTHQETEEAQIIPRSSRRKKANKRQRRQSQSISSLIRKMRNKAKMIKMRSHKQSLSFLYSNAQDFYLSSGINQGKKA